MYGIQVIAVVIGVCAALFLVLTHRQARRLMTQLYLKPGDSHRGNCSLVWLKQAHEGGWVLLHTSQMTPLITHVMYARGLPKDLEITHFQPDDAERQYGPLMSLIKAPVHKGKWVQETVGDWMSSAPQGWKE